MSREELQAYLRADISGLGVPSQTDAPTWGIPVITLSSIQTDSKHPAHTSAVPQRTLMSLALLENLIGYVLTGQAASHNCFTLLRAFTV
jgi:hypothetical protein